MKQTEAQFQQAVTELLELRNWKYVHHRPARSEKGWRTAVQGNGAKGFPDIVAVRDGRLLFIELKGTTGRLSVDQDDWMAELERVAEAYVWWPSDWEQVKETLL